MARSDRPSVSLPSGEHAAVLGQQAHQRQRRHALAAAAFANEGEGFAAVHRQAQAVNGAHQARFAVEADFEVVNFEHVGFRPVS
jgi:hypothetical protein